MIAVLLDQLSHRWNREVRGRRGGYIGRIDLGYMWSDAAQVDVWGDLWTKQSGKDFGKSFSELCGEGSRGQVDAYYLSKAGRVPEIGPSLSKTYLLCFATQRRISCSMFDLQ